MFSCISRMFVNMLRLFRLSSRSTYFLLMLSSYPFLSFTGIFNFIRGSGMCFHSAIVFRLGFIHWLLHVSQNSYFFKLLQRSLFIFFTILFLGSLFRVDFVQEILSSPNFIRWLVSLARTLSYHMLTIGQLQARIFTYFITCRPIYLIIVQILFLFIRL